MDFKSSGCTCGTTFSGSCLLHNTLPPAYKTLDDWADFYAKHLRENIETHVKVMTMGNLNEEQQASLVRLILISIREWSHI